jgi:hypothetical protein
MKQIKKISNAVPAFLLIITYSCTGAPTAKVAPPKAGTENATDWRYRVDGAPDAQILDPRKATVDLSPASPVAIEKASTTSRLKVPVIRIAGLRDADYVQVLRCADSFSAVTPDGTPISKLPTTDATRADKMRWAWQNAAGSNLNCRYVGTRIVRTTIPDLAAESGNFYYLINPCVSKSRSKSQREECSYNLAITESITYENNLEPLFLAAAKELSDAEGELSGNYIELMAIARQIAYKQADCQDAYFSAMARQQFISGLTSFIGMGVGFVVGSVIGGPLAGIKGAQTAAGITSVLFGQKGAAPFECPAVQDLTARARHVTILTTTATDNIIKLRESMEKLNSSYSGLNSSLQEYNTESEYKPY